MNTTVELPRSRRRRRGLPVGVWAGLLFLLALALFVWWEETRIHPTPESVFNGYAPRVGDVVFQSLPKGELVEMIEGATHSPLSHCGIVALDRGRWVVVEAIGPVKETPLERWIRRGRDWRLWAYRLEPSREDGLPLFVEAARTYLGRPYDYRYRMDDEEIYCSELVQKSYRMAYGDELGQLVRLDELDWVPYRGLIRRLEEGEPPLDRRIITPRDLARADALHPVYEP